MTELMVFDLDGTLAESKSEVDPEMGALLGALLKLTRVAVISGGDWPQFERQLLSALPRNESLKRLTLLPTCGTKFYDFEGDAWKLRFSDDLSAAERERITAALRTVIAEAQFPVSQTWGEVIEDRLSQITYSALGQEAPLSAKATWDADFAKRLVMKTRLEALIPGFSIRLGGTTSIDITRPGIDKGYGIRKLSEVLHVAIDKMIFIGDALFPGGNDLPAKEAGARSIQVAGPSETKRVIDGIVACLEVAGSSK